MANLKLEANYRTDITKSQTKKLRKEGFVTGSVFGHGVDPLPVAVRIDELAHKIKESDAGMMSLIDLKINGAPKGSDGTVIIKDFFKDPLTRKVLDVQFQRVSMKEKLHVDVPIELVGEAAGVKMGGILEQVIDAVSISCLPSNIPAKIEVDVTNLQMNHNIRVGELVVGEGIEVLTDPESVVCTCVPSHVTHKAEEATAEEAPPGPTTGSKATTEREA